MSERVSAPSPDLAVYPSIASSPKSQVKTVGPLVNHDGVARILPTGSLKPREVSVSEKN
jgi:hypothetical protein